MKEVYGEPSPAVDKSLFDEPVLFVSDSDNHCVRKIYLQQRIVKTYAGKCKTSGFKDGPTIINRFYHPGVMGINRQGVLVIYDSGNSYMRYIDIDGYVHTFIKGACRQDVRYPEISVRNSSYFVTKPVICYLDWKKLRGKPNEHIFEETIYSICTMQEIECDSS